MQLLTKQGEKIELTPLPTDVQETERAVRVEVAANIHRDAVSAGALVARAARGFFELGRTEGKAMAPAPPQGPPPQTFREERSGALRVVYREIAVRFKPKTSAKTRKDILATRGFAIRRQNPFVHNQYIVYQPDRK